jgi:hypothetical protein
MSKKIIVEDEGGVAEGCISTVKEKDITANGKKFDH